MEYNLDTILVTLFHAKYNKWGLKLSIKKNKQQNPKLYNEAIYCSHKKTDMTIISHPSIQYNY